MTVPSLEPSTPQRGYSQVAVLPVALRWGVGAGLLCGLWMVFLQLTGNNGFGPKQLLAQLLVPLAAVASEWLLRRKAKPAKPGLGRSLGVGTLTVLLAAMVSASSLVALAHGAGEPALARHRAEVLEIVRAQQQENPKTGLTAPQQQQQREKVAQMTIGDMALSNFFQVMVLGMVLALPAGIFLRE